MRPQVFETPWDFTSVTPDDGDDLVAVGADLEPGTIVAAYAAGLFPMGLGDGGTGPMGWWSPQERGVIRRGKLKVSRSLRKSARHFDITVDQGFEEVLAACADPERSGAWITSEITEAFTRLYELNVAHSVEVWRDGELVGGLYGLALGGLFAGESMFHRERDASKVALWALCDLVFEETAPRLIDVQWATDHLTSMGAEVMPRPIYRQCVEGLVHAPAIAAFGGSGEHVSQSLDTESHPPL